MSRPMTRGKTLPEHVFLGVIFGLVSKLGKFYIDFSALVDKNSMVMLVSATKLSIFQPFSILEV